ncbi:DNA-binding transcriptional repressor FabR [Vibrio mediterranei AK1]|nr:DNA-binding transcriptional repressor FabR [Vibrio mediterranei AK1]
MEAGVIATEQWVAVELDNTADRMSECL